MRWDVVLKSLVDLHPRNEFDHRLFGWTYESAGRLDEARKAYERAYALAIENASLHLDLLRASLETIRKRTRHTTSSVAPNGGRRS